jgi:hypothetical protein
MATIDTDSPSSVGLFRVTFDVGSGLMGAPTLTLNLLVSTPDARITGFGHLGAPISPPLDLSFKIDGDFDRLSWMGGGTVLVDLTGTPLPLGTGAAGQAPALPPDLHARLLLSADWASGTATYRYAEAHRQWRTVADVPVKLAASVAES